MVADVAGDGQNRAQIGFAVFARIGSDGDEQVPAMPDGGGAVVGELQPAALEVALQHVLEARFEDRAVAAAQGLEPFGVDVDTDNIVADIGQAGSDCQPNVAGAEDTYFHHVVLMPWCVTVRG